MRSVLHWINGFLCGSFATAFTWGPTNVGFVFLVMWGVFLPVAWFLARRDPAPAGPRA